jgi:ribonuclease R
VNRAARPARAPAGARVEGPAPADAVVAVLERRGRFLTAEPLFPRPADGASGAGGPRGRVRSSRLTLRLSGGRAADASAGDLVLVQPPRRGGEARIVRRLGRPDVARDVLEGLMLDRGLRRGFDPAVEREARAAGERVRQAGGERRDLRSLPTFTIDPVSARDFDDAISAEAVEGGRARVWVHIADVAAHVAEGSLLDREARRRATSVYVPGAVEPMLPHALSSDACSLRPGLERAAVTVELELEGAAVVRAAFYRSLIRSDERLDYERVDRIFAGQEQALDPWAGPLATARAVAGELQAKRERSGALAVESEEPEFAFDEEGNVREIRGVVQTESHRLIEHLMIAANEAVAGLLAQRGVPCLYRVHERPDPERIERLVDQLASLEVPTPPLPEPMSSTQAAELVGQVSQLIERYVRRTGHGRLALDSLVLRSLKQAYYSPRNLGHAGLRSSAYCHFTSPIRRYPDIVCHRALLSAVGGGETAPRASELAELGAWTSERERDAMTIERDADDVARCFALERLLFERGMDAVFSGEITGLIPAGAFVAFGELHGRGSGEGGVREQAPPFEGMLPVRLLRAPGQEAPREWWELNEEGTILHGERSGATLRLGDAIAVRVARVEAIRGRVDLVAAG